MTKVEHVYLLKWDGTPERYNEIFDKCFPEDLYQVDFVDDKFDRTNKITTRFRVFFMGNTYARDEERTKKEYASMGRQYDGTYFEAPYVIPMLIKEEESS